MILYYLAQIGLSLIGVSCYIAFIFKKEGDKYQDSRASFNYKKYAKNNIFDFVFYVIAGLGMLTVKSLVKDYVGLEGITDMGLSFLCGLLGSIVLEKMLPKA